MDLQSPSMSLHHDLPLKCVIYSYISLQMELISNPSYMWFARAISFAGFTNGLKGSFSLLCGPQVSHCDWLCAAHCKP